MANRPFLLSHDSPAPLIAADADDAIVAAASNQLPLLWLSSFSPADLTTVEMALEDADGIASRGPVPTLFAQAVAARRTYAARRERLVASVPAALHTHIAEWEELLESLPGAFIQIDLAEIWMMFREDEFRDTVGLYFAGLDGSSEDGWRELLGQACLDDPSVARYGMRGYQWNAPVPWTD